MFPISDAELTELQRAAEQSLFETCTIYTKTGTHQDSYGQTHRVYEETEDVPCDIQFQKLEFQDERSQAVVLSGDAILRIRLDQPIGVEDYVVVRGKAYAVDGVFDGLTVRQVALKISALPEDI